MTPFLTTYTIFANLSSNLIGDLVVLKTDLIDYFDEDYNHLGMDTHASIHLRSLWHQSLNCWFINPHNKRFLIVRFSPDRTFMSNKLDIAMFGVVLAGEMAVDGYKTISSRLKTNLNERDLIKIGITKEITFAEDLGVLHKTFVHSFFVKKEIDLKQPTKDMEFIDGLFEASIQDGLHLFSGEKSEIVIEGYDSEGNVKFETISYDDFVPRGRAYLYKTIFMIKEWLEMDEWEQKYEAKWRKQ